MISKTEETTTLIKDFDQLAQTLINQSTNPKLKENRQKALSRFQKLGLPTTKDEEWKYTNITPIVKNIFTLSQEGNLIEKESLSQYLDPQEINLVFVNGRFAQNLSNYKNLPGISILALEEASTQHASFLETLSKQPDPEETAFSSLNKALSLNGLFIQVAEKAVCEKLIHIVHVTSIAASSAAGFGRAK